MANLNKVMLIGNLTRDPELRVTPKGTAICQFSLAVNRKFKDESGGEREEVTYVDIEAWGKSGENISKYCTKGRPLFVEGRLRLDQWEDKTTKEKRSRMKVVLENFQFLGSGRADGAPGGGEGGGENRYASPAPRGPAAPKPAAPAAQENLDEERTALGAILGDVLAGFAPGFDVDVGHLFAVGAGFVAELAVHGQAELADGGALRRDPEFGIARQVADEHDFVEIGHGIGAERTLRRSRRARDRPSR